jgi:hypothetical protein
MSESILENSARDADRTVDLRLFGSADEIAQILVSGLHLGTPSDRCLWRQAMADIKNQMGRQLGTASEKRKAPRRELEGQVEMLAHGVNSKSEHRNLEKRWIRYKYARLPEERADVEFDLVSTTKHAVPIGNSMCEMTIFRACPFGNESRIRLQSTQPHRQSSRRHAPRYINCMDGNATRFVLTRHVRHPLALSRFARADYHRKPAMHSATMQRAEPTDNAGRG